MSHDPEEHDRPGEWLRKLEQEPSAYRDLLEHTGDFALAAYRLARARCRVAPLPSRVPTIMELEAAARILAQKSPGTPLPPPTQLVNDCVNAGAFVIA
jgi:hypothetical protein